jgi:putative oxidoreductase
MKFLLFLRSLALLIARLALGGILIAHGFMRWRVHGISKEIAYVQQYGVPYPEVAAWGATILELVGGLFLIVGALTPLVALAVLAEQILIIAYITWRNGLYLVSSTGTYAGGYEYSVALAALALLFVVFGGGAASIDRLFRRKKDEVTEEAEPVPTMAPNTGILRPGPATGPAPGSSSTNRGDAPVGAARNF